MKRYILLILLVGMSLSVAMPEVWASAQTRKEASAKGTGGKRGKKAKTGASAAVRGKSTKKGGAKSGKGSGKTKRTESSAEMKRREAAARQEITRTKAELEANEKKVKKELADLNRLGAEISESRKRVADMSAQVRSLDGKIGNLQGTIQANEKDLSRMREKYLQAVKRMQATKGKRSTLAFIFASKSFNQAMRRMRYMRQFSEWREKQTKLISAKVSQLKYQTELLGQTKADKSRVLNAQVSEQKKLETQHSRQDVLVSNLKKNSGALRSHLAKKQNEANELRNQIAVVIAREQREAEEKVRREEQARKEAEERRLREERRREEERLLAQAEAQKREESAKRAESAEKNVENKEKAGRKQAKESSEAKREKTRKRDEKASRREKENKEKDRLIASGKTKDNSSSDYAKARRRQGRRDNAAPAKEKSGSVPKVAKVEKPAKQAAGNFGNFAAAKGSLPRPVSGSFRVTSPFGKHPLPDLPGVVYDNPGIDAEVSSGATAQAVYAGKVSGVYVLPGFNTVVIVNHGGYYTIYGNIASPSVKVGDNVKQGQGLGRLAEDPDSPGHSTIHFEVWKNREKQNPQSWIR